MNPEQFALAVLNWHAKEGRKNLPWQQNKTPYRIWVSEIMLQQTQVTTVISYFEKFIARFPDVATLADADLDEILTLWSGLGYYSRARNMHKAAILVKTRFKSSFPKSVKMLEQLPGVGRSTAGAITSMGYNLPAPILDGNVKRVLSRFSAIRGWSGLTSVSETLWNLAEYYLPKSDNANYTQAMMDLGALICTRKNPKCSRCPLKNHCSVFGKNIVSQIPEPRPQKKLPLRHTIMLVAISKKDDSVLMERRPEHGIWGGLWSFPEYDKNISQAQLIEHIRQDTQLTPKPSELNVKPSFVHKFTHFHLHITPVIFISEKKRAVSSRNITKWIEKYSLENYGIPQPVKKILSTINKL